MYGEHKNATFMHEAGNKICFLELQETLHYIWEKHSTHWANRDWKHYFPAYHGHKHKVRSLSSHITEVI